MLKPVHRTCLTAGVAVLALAALIGGCRLNEGESAAPEERNTLAVAAVIANTSFFDASGKIEIRVKTCDPTASASTNCAYCLIDDDYALVGGGANILNGAAMLQASFPDPTYAYTANFLGCTGPAGANPPRNGIDNKNKWTARASGAPHQLQAYVIGMRLKGTNGNWFKPTVSEPRDANGILVNPPNVLQVDAREEVLKNLNQILIGGGAYIYKGDGNLNQAAATNAYLVGSFPVGSGPTTRAWRGIARSQTNPAPMETMKAFALLMDQCPTGFSQCFDYPQIRSLTAAAVSGVGTASQYHFGFGVNTSVGGYAATTGGARYLAGLVPFYQSTFMGFTAQSRAFSSGSGQTTGYGLNLSLPASGIAAYTAVYNHSNKCMGVLNSRMDATAPFTQKTCTYGNEPANLRFAMIPRPNGYVALKFEHSGMCLDISGGSMLNGAAAIQYPCTYNDNQLVQLLNYGAGNHYFKFKHSTKCLDVYGAGTADGTTFIQYTCANQPNQTFHFDD